MVVVTAMVVMIVEIVIGNAREIGADPIVAVTAVVAGRIVVHVIVIDVAIAHEIVQDLLKDVLCTSIGMFHPQDSST